MKRKVIQLANSTAVISLPSKWVKKYGVKKGDEIEVGEEESRLIVTAEQTGSPKKQEIEVDMAGMAPRALMWTLVGLYRAGYDRIRILYDDTIQFEQIHLYVGNLLEGFQLTEEGKGYCVVESVSKGMEADFLPLFRKTLRLVSAMGQSSLEAIRNNDLQQLKEVLVLEDTNNRLSILCERMLTKGACGPSNVKSYFFVMAWHSQKMCNLYRDLCRYLVEKQKLKLSKKLFELYAYTNQVVQSYEEQYNHTEISRLVELFTETRRRAMDVDIAVYSKEEQRVVFYLLSILHRVSDISTVLIGIHESLRQKKDLA